MFWATKSIFTRTETSQNGVFNNYEPKRARVETGKKLIANYILFNTTITASWHNFLNMLLPFDKYTFSYTNLSLSSIIHRL